MTRTRTLIIIGVFMLCLAVLAALEFRTEDSVLSEGQMVTGSVSKDVSEVIPFETPPTPEQPLGVPLAQPPASTKGGVLVPLDSGTLRGTSGTTLDMTSTAQIEAALRNIAPSEPVDDEPIEQPEQAQPAPIGKNIPGVVEPVPPTPAPTPAPVAAPARATDEKRATAPTPVRTAEPEKPKTAPSKEKTPAPVAPAKTAPSRVEKPEAKPLVLTSKAPATLVGKQKAITQTRLELGKDMSFKITGAEPLAVKTLLLENPDRYVVDLQGEWGIQLPRVPKNLLLKEIRVGQREGATRLVFELIRKPEDAQVDKVNAKTVDVRIR